MTGTGGRPDTGEMEPSANIGTFGDTITIAATEVPAQ